MHPLSQYYSGGADSALAQFGLEKVALMSQTEREAFMAAHRAKPKGLAAVGGAGVATASPAPAMPSVGGPGMDPRFAGRGINMETNPFVARQNMASRGITPTGGQTPAAAGPVALHPGMNVVGHLLLPWPE